METAAFHQRSLIPILYEDDFYIAFEKPVGLLVVPTPKKEKNTLLRIVNEQNRVSATSEKLFPCHRLDRDTSGVILFAKGEGNQQRMMNEFRTKAVDKKYIAFVDGKLKHKVGELKSIVKDFHMQKFDRQSSGQLAITRYRVLATKRLFTVVEASPITGRTNQIRIQFTQIGHPLLGERQYAFGRDFKIKFRRTALHAASISFRHPVFKKQITINSPLPKDMEVFLGKN